jgi:hypothetical protein
MNPIGVASRSHQDYLVEINKQNPWNSRAKTLIYWSVIEASDPSECQELWLDGQDFVYLHMITMKYDGDRV